MTSHFTQPLFARRSNRWACAFSLSSAALALLLLGGCANPAGIEPKATVQDPAHGLTPAVTTGAPEWARTDAWLDFGDAQLAHLIQQARDNNPSLAVAQTRLEKAKAYVGLADAALQPKVNGKFEMDRNTLSKNPVFFGLGGKTYDADLAILGASWELDFFGKNEATLKAALGQTKASEADWQAARTLLSSQVARGYWQWVRVQAQIKLAQALLQERETQLKLIRQRLAEGLDTQLELRQAQAGLPEIRGAIEALIEQRDNLQHALGALVGSMSATADLKVPAIDWTQWKIEAVPDEVPLDLIGRRPDVLASKWRVEATTQDRATAKAAFYPNINLSFNAVALSAGFDRIFNSPGQLLGGGPAISLPLFDGGRLRANLGAKTADVDAAVNSYNSVVLDAVREVADLVSTGQSLVKQQAEQKLALQTAIDAHHIAQQRFEAGLITAFPVLMAKSNVLNQERLTIDLQARVLDNRAALWRALGSGMP